MTRAYCLCFRPDEGRGQMKDNFMMTQADNAQALRRSLAPPGAGGRWLPNIDPRRDELHFVLWDSPTLKGVDGELCLLAWRARWTDWPRCSACLDILEKRGGTDGPAQT